LTFAPP